MPVSIPQAVSTVATTYVGLFAAPAQTFQYRKR